MGFAVEMFFDEETEERFQTLWRTLSEKQISSVLPAVGSHPHISFVAFETVDIGGLYEPLRAFAERIEPFTVKLSAIGVFPSAEGVVYIAPVVTGEMLEVHGMLHRCLNELGVPSISYYRPGQWIPHCTVAINLPPEKVSVAVEICRSSDVFGDARLVKVGLVEFRPVRVHYRFPLGGGE